MGSLFHSRYVPLTIVLLLTSAAAVVIALPPEATLGGTIRIVLFHGALARAGMIAFAVAGGLGAALILRSDERLASWTLATQVTAFGLWTAAALTSTVATYLSWGVVIAWGEPRTQGTIKILILAILLLALVAWIRQHRFTGLANLVLAVFSWWTVLGATSVQHPEDPVGTSPSDLYRTGFLALVLILLLTAVQVARWIRRPKPAGS